LKYCFIIVLSANIFAHISINSAFGQITSKCSASEVPTEDDQSNFGKGYDYQYGSVEGRIEIQMTDGNWYVFVTEEVKANYKP